MGPRHRGRLPRHRAAQFWLYFRGLAPPLAAYLFILVDSLALAAVLLLPNPFVTPALPPALPLRYASFMYFFVLLMQAAFSFRPRLLAVDRAVRRRRLDGGLRSGS